MRPNPIYSVALVDDSVVSSVYGGLEVQYVRTINLWSTNSDYRQKGIGKAVLYNFIKYCFDNNHDIQLMAEDVTSEQIDKVLINIGFK